MRTLLLAGCLTATALAEPLPREAVAALERLRSPQLAARSEAFYALMKRYGGSPRLAVPEMLAAHPEDAERIRTSLIAALETEGRYRRESEASNRNLTESFTDYWADLMLAVGELRDPRAADGLLEGVDTGGIAVKALVAICPSAWEKIELKTREPNRTFQGMSFATRSGAYDVLGACLNRPGFAAANPKAVARIRDAIRAGLRDPEWYVRAAAVKAAEFFRQDPEVRADLERVAASDAGLLQVGPTPYPVREAARRILDQP